MTWHSRYWGRDLNSETLIGEIRDYWWEPNPFDHSTHSIHSDPAAMRAYARYVNDSIVYLEKRGLGTYLKSSPPAIHSDGLSKEQLQLVKARVRTFEAFVNDVVTIGLKQHQEMMAINLRSWEGGLKGSDSHPPAYSSLPLQPISMKPYTYNPETRMLGRTVTFRGREIRPTLIHKPGEGGVWNTVIAPLNETLEEE